MTRPMRHTFIATPFATPFATLVLCLAPVVCLAQPVDAERDAALFLESVVVAKRGPLCGARMPGFAQRFEPTFAQWRVQRARQLEAGEAALREATVKESIDFAQHVGSISDRAARTLGKASQGALEVNCEAMLRRLAEP
jgi:hypothetical protein